MVILDYIIKSLTALTLLLTAIKMGYEVKKLRREDKKEVEKEKRSAKKKQKRQ